MIPNLKLNDGREIPMLGLGTYECTDENEMKTAVRAAIDAGYRHFDCAYFYNNEQFIGKAILEAIEQSNGKLKREDFYIVSKVWNTYHSKERVPVCLQKTLDRLGFDYVDLYLIHWPMGFLECDNDLPSDPEGNFIPSDVHFTETYKAMEELFDQGKCKSIGISNFSIEQTKEILSICRIKPVCNQVEVNPYFQNEQLVEYSQAENIAIVAYGSLRSTVYIPSQIWIKPENLVPQENPEIVKIAKKYNKTPAHVILRWLIQRNIVVIPKSSTPSRIAENAKIFDFELNEEEMNTLKNLKKGSRINHFEGSRSHPLYPFQNEN